MKHLFFTASIIIAWVHILSCDRLNERTTRHENGKIRDKYSFIKDKKNGEIKEGLHTRWDSSGKKLFEKNWHDNQMHGAATHYFKGGGVRYRIHWISGKRFGPYESFFPEGKNKQKGQ